MKIVLLKLLKSKSGAFVTQCTQVHREVPRHGHWSQSDRHACCSYLVSFPFSWLRTKLINFHLSSVFSGSASPFRALPTSSWSRSGWSSPWSIPSLRPWWSASRMPSRPRPWLWEVQVMKLIFKSIIDQHFSGVWYQLKKWSQTELQVKHHSFKVQFEVFIFNPGSTDAAIKYSQLLQSPSSYHIGRLVSFSPILPRNTTTIVENLFSNQSNNICNLTPFKGVMMYQHCSEKRKIQFFKEAHV